MSPEPGRHSPGRLEGRNKLVPQLPLMVYFSTTKSAGLLPAGAFPSVWASAVPRYPPFIHLIICPSYPHPWPGLTECMKQGVWSPYAGTERDPGAEDSALGSLAWHSETFFSLGSATEILVFLGGMVRPAQAFPEGKWKGPLTTFCQALGCSLGPRKSHVLFFVPLCTAA